MNLITKPSTRNYMPSTWQNISRIEKSDRHTPLMGACYTWGRKSPKENIKTSPLERQQTLGGFSLCCIKTTSMKIVVDNLSDCGILCIELIVTQQKSSLTICIHIFYDGDLCSGSTADFDSVSTSSILVSPAISKHTFNLNWQIQTTKGSHWVHPVSSWIDRNKVVRGAKCVYLWWHSTAVVQLLHTE